MISHAKHIFFTLYFTKFCLKIVGLYEFFKIFNIKLNLSVFLKWDLKWQASLLRTGILSIIQKCLSKLILYADKLIKIIYRCNKTNHFDNKMHNSLLTSTNFMTKHQLLCWKIYGFCLKCQNYNISSKNDFCNPRIEFYMYINLQCTWV